MRAVPAMRIRVPLPGLALAAVAAFVPHAGVWAQLPEPAPIPQVDQSGQQDERGSEHLPEPDHRSDGLDVHRVHGPERRAGEGAGDAGDKGGQQEEDERRCPRV
ncbi:MAG: hypothetical protein RQ751_11435, partial [Longimicrobiales bacterium]|nr:hypothetical protein [Longimicrobiales bacterium]